MKHLFFFLAFCLLAIILPAQVIDCSSPQAYKEIPPFWKQAGEVIADITRENMLEARPGSGILVNISSANTHGSDLYTRFEHGDADIEFEYLMARGANSGVYLQGRYEVQLFDSWGKKNVSSSDNGGIYERWDDNRPGEQKGFSGIAPRQNASRAPGLWQHMKISFMAPRFDASGNKVENARITKVELNGVLIHDNVELSGVTRGAVGAEQPKGPLRIQGDHGSIAFRNFRLTPYDKARPELKDVRYRLYKGIYKKEPDYGSVSPEAQGTQERLSARISNLPDTFLIHYSGNIQVKESGDYRFKVGTMGGKAILRINNKAVATLTENNKDATTKLEVGSYPFEIVFTRVQDWGNPTLTVSASGPGFREFMLSDVDDVSTESTDPILVNAEENTLLRSFMDIPGKRIIHAVSAGSPENLHYTYDMDCGALVQVWRGGFLDATPMWHERGDGSSRPLGTVLLFGDPSTLISRLADPSSAWKADTIGTGFRQKGYRLDALQRPVFRYQVHGATVNDALTVTENNTGFKREINVLNAATGMFARLAVNEKIEQLAKDFFLIGDHAYYIKIDNSNGAAMIRSSNNKKEIIVPVSSKLVYSILF